MISQGRPCAADGSQLQLFTGEEYAEERPRSGLSAQMTLTEFYRQYVQSVVLVPRGSAQRNLDQYRQSLGYWARFTGDPRLWQIDESVCAAFVAAVAELPGRDGPLSPNTIRKHCVEIQRVLDLAGPRTRNNRSAKGLIAEPPYLERPPAREKAAEDCFAIGEIRQWLDVCYLACRPRVPGLLAGRWWESLIVTLYNTGVRIGTAMDLTWPMIQGSWLVIPPAAAKGRRRGLQVPINAAAREALESIRGDRERVWPWPHRQGWLHACRRRLLAATEIAPARRFGFHGLRKALANQLWERDPVLAQRMLGHTTIRTTRDSYAHPSTPDGQLQRALAKIEQPV